MAEEERKKLDPVVHVDESRIKKKSIGKQFVSSLFTSDIGIIGERLGEIVVDSIKDTVVDVGCTFFIQLFGGDSRSSSRRWNSLRDDRKTSYGTIYRTNDTGIYRPVERKSYEDNNISYNRRSSTDYLDIPFDRRPEAEKVLNTMRDMLESYPSVSIADFYDLVGYNYGNNFTLNDYGWTDLSDVNITWSRGAWYIAFPRAVVIR